MEKKMDVTIGILLIIGVILSLLTFFFLEPKPEKLIPIFFVLLLMRAIHGIFKSWGRRRAIRFCTLVCDNEFETAWMIQNKFRAFEAARHYRTLCDCYGAEEKAHPVLLMLAELFESKRRLTEIEENKILQRYIEKKSAEFAPASKFQLV